MIFWMSSGVLNGATDRRWVNYYPRALESLAPFGRTLSEEGERYGITSFALPDAGQVAYLSNLNALDNIGLGSSLVAHHGVSPTLLDAYGIGLIALQARPEGIRLGDYNQREVLDWGKSNGLRYLCRLYFEPDKFFEIYTRVDVPEIHTVCASSDMRNNISNRVYFRTVWQKPLLCV